MPDSHASTVSTARRILYAAGLLLAVSAAFYAVFVKVNYQWSWDRFWDYRQLFLRGWLTTLLLSLAAMVVSVVLGFLFMLGRRSPWEPVRMLCTGVVEVVRGSPLLVQLLLGYYVVGKALDLHQPVVTGVVLLGCFEGAYLAEIFRGAVESISASQLEAARAVGFSRLQTYRFVIVPQAMRRALPGTTGQLVSLIKDSSLLSVIGIEEMVKNVQNINAATYKALEGFLPLAAAYLIMTLPLSYLARRLERRYAYET